jgi:hypothetical protein
MLVIKADGFLYRLLLQRIILQQGKMSGVIG